VSFLFPTQAKRIGILGSLAKKTQVLGFAGKLIPLRVTRQKRKLLLKEETMKALHMMTKTLTLRLAFSSLKTAAMGNWYDTHPAPLRSLLAINTIFSLRQVGLMITLFSILTARLFGVQTLTQVRIALNNTFRMLKGLMSSIVSSSLCRRSKKSCLS